MPVTSFLPHPPSLDALRAEGPVALFLDFDGTLVDIAPTPDAIRVPAGLAGKLQDLADRLEGRLALVSGRALDDLQTHIGPLGIARAGSHGIDRRLADGTLLSQPATALPGEALRELIRFADLHGFALEEKPHGAALHYRAIPDLEQVGLVFARALAASHALELKRGKCVLELVQPGADKGGAVRAFMQLPQFSGARPVFIGDDVTDEDGFAAIGEFEGAGILVGDRRSTQAQFRLENPQQVLTWLELA